jgi:hypothetical protein
LVPISVLFPKQHIISPVSKVLDWQIGVVESLPREHSRAVPLGNVPLLLLRDMLRLVAVLAGLTAVLGSERACSTYEECQAVKSAMVDATGLAGLGTLVDNVINSRSVDAWQQRPAALLHDTDQTWCPNSSYWVRSLLRVGQVQLDTRRLCVAFRASYGVFNPCCA